jgi:hypothetical protein
MGTKSNVHSGKPNPAGCIYRADLPLASGTTLPASTSAALTGFDNLGYLSSDGLSNSWEAGDAIEAWGGDIVLQAGRTDTFTFTMIESSNANVLKAVYGNDNVEVITVSSASETKVSVNSDDAVSAAWVFDMLLKGNRKKRIVIPSGIITAVDTISYAGDNAVGYAVTIRCDEDSTGNTHYEYISETE